MSLPKSVTWLSRHAESVLVALCLFEYCAVAHYLALGAMEKHSRYVSDIDDKSAKRMAIIDLLQNHGWMVAFYAAIFVACLIWMENRSTPRWALWASFIAMAIPCLAYSWGCVAVVRVLGA